jgi:hypothetical protein
MGAHFNKVKNMKLAEINVSEFLTQIMSVARNYGVKVFVPEM